MAATTYIADPHHSAIHFKVRHLHITNIQGMFQNFEVSMQCPSQLFKNATVRCVIESSSLFTNNRIRDNHLKSPDFFDVDQFPLVHIEGKLKELDRNNYRLQGNMKLKDIVKPVNLMVEYLGNAEDGEGHEVAGFSIYGTLTRTDWDLDWNTVLPSGFIMLGDEVVISGELQMRKTENK